VNTVYLVLLLCSGSGKWIRLKVQAASRSVVVQKTAPHFPEINIAQEKFGMGGPERDLAAH
jgi:hypothetical protein